MMKNDASKIKKGLQPSLRKILAAILIVTLGLLLMSSLFISISVNDSIQKNRDRMRQLFDSRSEGSTNMLIEMNYYLVDMLYNNVHINAITSDSTTNARNTAARNLLKDLSADKRFQAEDFSILFYHAEYDLAATSYNYSLPYADNASLRNFIIEMITDDDFQNISTLNWSHIVINGTPYIYQLYYNGNNYIACWLNCRALIGDVGSILTEGSQVFWLDNQGQDLSDGTILDLEAINRKYDFVEAFDIARTDIYLLTANLDYFDFSSISYILYFLLTMIFIVLFIAVYTLYYYKKYIIEPFSAFQKHVGEYSYARETAKKRGFEELNSAVEAFDSITAQLESLKIQVYEDKLAHAKTELEYYHIQIKPHFFVNCFSLIHAMAQKKEYAKIQAFCIKLSTYVRYLLNNSLSLIPLKEELQVTREYLDIQRIRYRMEANLKDDIAQELMDIKIPVLSILTFVENSIKHGTETGNGISISIHVALFDDQLFICIEDNGIGFPEEILSMYNCMKNIKSENYPQSRHIGIQNQQTAIFDLRGRLLSALLQHG